MADLETEIARQRLVWSCRRGMLELDILLQDFISKGYEDLDAAGKSRFKDLLDYPDAVLFDLLMGKSASADPGIANVIEKIRTHNAY